MDSAVIRKILDTSTLELLGAKAVENIKRRSQARSAAMTRPRAPRRGQPAAPLPDERADPVAAPADDAAQGFGPLESFEEALDSIDALVDEPDEQADTDIEALHEIEDNIGIATWLDPETGEPAEGMCPPHLDAE
jgi:hypothetical protein